MRFRLLFLILIAVLSFSLPTFAQEVRLIYFHPKGTDPLDQKNAINQQLNILIERVQNLFRNQIGKSFEVEQENGNVKVHYFEGDDDYIGYRRGSRLNAEKIRDEIIDSNGYLATEMSNYLYLIAADIRVPPRVHVPANLTCGQANYLVEPSWWQRLWDGAEPVDRPWAVIDVSERCFGDSPIWEQNISIASWKFRVWITAHELGHAFGLQHDFVTASSNKYIMSYGRNPHPNGPFSPPTQLSPCTKEWLKASRFFNPNLTPPPDQETEITLNSVLYSLEKRNLHLEFTGTDGNGLRVAQLFLNPGVILLGCQSLNGQSDGIEFNVPNFSEDDYEIARDEVRVQVIDSYGYIIRKKFSLRQPIAEGSISDVTLAVDETKTLDASDYFRTDLSRLIYSADSDNKHVLETRTSPAGSQITLIPQNAGSALVTVTARAGGFEATQRFTVTVRPRHQPPELVDTLPDQTLTVGDPATPLDLSTYFSDPDGKRLTYTIELSNPNTVLPQVIGSQLTIWILSPGSTTVTVIATNTNDLSIRQIFTVAVTDAQNRVPTAVDTIPDQTLTVGDSSAPLDLSTYFHDPDEDALTYTVISSDPNVATVQPVGSQFTIWTLNLGNTTVTVRATDPNGLFITQTFTVTVDPAAPTQTQHPEPVGEISDQTLAESGSSKTVDVSAYFSDPERDILIYTAWTDTPSVVKLWRENSLLTITAKDVSGTATVTVKATDPDGLHTIQHFTVRVTIPDTPPPNRAPQVLRQIPAHILTVGNSAARLSVSGFFNDPDDDALTYTSSASHTSVVTVSPSGSPVLITPVAAGTATITVTASDGKLQVTQSFTVTITGSSQQNQAPEVINSFNPQNFRVSDEPKWRNLSSYFSDPDNNTLTYKATSSNSRIAAASISGNSVKITPGEPGTATITVTASDGELQVTQNFRVTVQTQLQTIPSLPVCERTPQVREEIMKRTRDNNCTNVTEDELASIRRLIIIAEGLITLQQGDFDELRNLEELVLNENSLRTLPEDVFWYLGGLEELSLRDNQITTLVKDTFEHLDSLTYLTLRGNQLTTLQQGAFDDLEMLIDLDLSDNQLTTLPAGVFEDLSSLEELTLENNRIAILSRGGFLGLSSLEDLVLEENPLHTIKAGAFNGLSSLTDLNFNSYLLHTIEAGAFNGLSSLTDLDLGHTQLSTLRQGVFSSLLNLENLYLRGNPLHTIEAGAFNGLSSLSYLDLRDAQLNILQQGVFSGLSSLKDLNLDGNPLHTIEAGAFNGLSSLTDLDLDNAQLNTLRQGVFSSLSSLENLDLYGNSLRAIEVGAFNGLSNLISLDLDENQLTTLPVGIFSGFSRLARLDLRDNPGAPFTLTLELARTDKANLAAGPATVKVKLAEGAPFDMSIRLSIEGGTLSADTATLTAGQIESNPITVTQTGTSLATVRLEIVPTIPQGYRGIQMAVGTPLVLFSEQLNRPPVAVGTIPPQTLSENDPPTVVDVAAYFSNPNNTTLIYIAVSDNTAVVLAEMRGSELTLTSVGAGNTTVSVAVSDGALTATQVLSISVTEIETEGADLFVDSVSVNKNTVGPGETFRLDAVVKNQGETEANGTTLRYYQSTDAMISDTDTQLKTSTLGLIEVDAMKEPWAQLTAPETPGVYYYGICVDAVANESDTANNCSTAVVVTVLGADLVINSVRVEKPTASLGEKSRLTAGVKDRGEAGISDTPDRSALSMIAPGDQFRLNAVLQNRGKAASTDTTLRYYLSVDDTISPEDMEVHTATLPIIAADAMREPSVQLTAPDAPGVYYYGVCVDAVEGESDTNNNCSTAVAVTVENTGRVDFVVESVRASKTTVKPGENFQISAVIRNQGEIAATATVLRYYLSMDEDITTADTEIHTATLPIIAADATRQQSRQFIAPDPPGTYYYGVCVDTVEGEDDTDNNCSVAVAVTVGGADLMIDGTPQVSKTTLSPGETFQINTRVWNAGSAISDATTLRYYLSTDDTISSEDTEVDSDNVAVLSGKGAHASRRRAELSKTLTAPDTPGVYYYGVCVDSVAGDADTSNNCSEAIAVTVEAPPEPVVIQVPGESENLETVEIQGPDLIISAARVDSATIKLGEGVRIHITLTNQGTSEAPATTIRYYRSSDVTITEEDTELRGVPVGALGSGRSYTTWALLPGATSLGVYYYGACLEGVASEFDTSNNCSDVFEITVEARGKPVLVPVGTISTQVLTVGGPPLVLNMSGNFVGKVENWIVRSGEPNVVAASMSSSEVILTPISRGWARVTIEAISGKLIARQAFHVSVSDGGVFFPEPADIPDVSGPDYSPEVSIPDANLRTAVREALGLAEGTPITEQKMKSLKLRTIFNRRGITDLTGLEYATNVRDLHLYSNQISDITPLANLTNLIGLHLYNNQISDITPLANLTNLTQLDLRESPISDFTPLGNLTALTKLLLDGTQISDLTPLRNLTALQVLFLNRNQISDVTPLANLTNLTELQLTVNQISDAAPLEGLTSLKRLALVRNSVTDLAPLHRLKEKNPSVSIDLIKVPDTPAPEVPDTTPPEVPDPSVPDLSTGVSIPDENLRTYIRSALGLGEGDTITQQAMTRLTRLGNSVYSGVENLTGLEHATQLTWLRLSGSISDITSLANLTNLTYIEIQGTQISDITPLANLTALTTLKLSNNQISDITPLASMTALTTLELSNNQISNITPLANLTALTRLRLDDNQISNITPLQNLRALTFLYLNNNQISNITSLGNLTALSTQLNLSRNQISDITPLANLTNITYINLHSNQVSNISPISGLTAITDIDLGNNQISTIPSFSGMTALTHLRLYHNQISDITGLEGMTGLQALYLKDNQISDITSLQNLTTLTILWLEDNQITDVTSLEGLTSLLTLTLSGNAITDLAPLRRLKENNPNLNIDIDINADLNNAPTLPSTPVLPEETALWRNYPNPFNPETWIPYQLAKSADVTLTIYDVRGVVVRQLALGHRPPGFYYSQGRAAHWDGRNQLGEKVASGVYFYTFTAGEFAATQKLLIRK